MSKLSNTKDKIKSPKNSSLNDDLVDDINPNTKDSITELTIEDIYQKMEHKEHALELPDTYIGSIELHEEVMWVVDENIVIQPTFDDGMEKSVDGSVVSNNAIDSVPPTVRENSTDVSLNNSQADVVDIKVDGKITETKTDTDKPEADKTDTCIRMVLRKIKYVPGLYKIYDEILVNALDHWTRMEERIRKQNLIKSGEMAETREITLKMKFKPVKNIKVTIDQALNQISIYNDGDGIPVELHKEFEVYVPELLFSQFLTSGNYKGKNGTEINQIKIIGGKNGYGGKLTALFSRKFTIETVDANNQKK